MSSTDTIGEPALALRVARLERQNRLLLISFILVLGVSVAAFASEAGQVPDLVQARRIQLVDQEGRVRMDLAHDSSGTRLYVHDAAGDVRVGVAQFSHGGGGVALHGPGGKGAAVLYLRGDGSLTLYDTTGAVTARWPPR